MQPGVPFDFIFSFWTGFAIVVLVILKGGVKFVPQNSVYIIERFGKYHMTLEAGLNFIFPFIDRIAYVKSLKETAVDVARQGAITRDNITLDVDGILYVKIIDPYKASYGVEDYTFAVIQLAQTTMRSEIGKLELDRTFEERSSLNTAIVSSINEAAMPWGVQVLRYEIKDITPPKSILESMERQMKAERGKRAAILESEGMRQAAINKAEGEKEAKVLAAEADKREQILNAEGEAQAILTVAEARASALAVVGKAVSTEEGQKAMQLDLATLAIEAKKAIAKASTVVLMDAKAVQASQTVIEAISIAAAMNKSSAFSQG